MDSPFQASGVRAQGGPPCMRCPHRHMQLVAKYLLAPFSVQAIEHAPASMREIPCSRLMRRSLSAAKSRVRLTVTARQNVVDPPAARMQVTPARGNGEYSRSARNPLELSRMLPIEKYGLGLYPMDCGRSIFLRSTAGPPRTK